MHRIIIQQHQNPEWRFSWSSSHYSLQGRFKVAHHMLRAFVHERMPGARTSDCDDTTPSSPLPLSRQLATGQDFTSSSSSPSTGRVPSQTQAPRAAVRSDMALQQTRLVRKYCNYWIGTWVGRRTFYVVCGSSYRDSKITDLIRGRAIIVRHSDQSQALRGASPLAQETDRRSCGFNSSGCFYLLFLIIQIYLLLLLFLEKIL